MPGEILKTGANITKSANTILVNATNGDIDLSSAKNIVQSSDSTINHGSYKQPDGPETQELLVTEVTGPDKVEVGQVYTFEAVKFSRKPVGGELQRVKWAYKIDDGEIKDFSRPGDVIGTIVRKIIRIPGTLFDNEKITVYAYLQSPSVNVESEIDAIDLPFIMDKYRAPGERAAGVLANDMGYGDGVNMTTGHAVYTRKQIEDVGWLMKSDIDKPESFLWSNFQLMVTSLFSVGELQAVALKMIAKFRSNSGGEFTDTVLTEKVVEHDSTQRFVTSLRTIIVDTIKREGGDITSLKNETIDWTGKPYGRPRFSTLTDTFAGGLTICINDVWAYEVSITEYEVDDKEFTGKFKITLFDQFGLDKPDVDKKYGYLAGFRCWFLLQHRRNYKPFITKIEFEEEFEGTF
ncbi:MAG: DUF3289 family protein [Crocinitomicaceae bacterium]